MKEKEVVEYYNSLPREQQLLLLRELSSNTKPKEYSLRIKLTETNKIAEVVLFLSKHEVPFEARKVGEKLHLLFTSIDNRNLSLLAAMFTGRNSKIIDVHA